MYKMESNANWNSYQTNDSGTNEFTRLAHLISSQIQKISQNANTTQRMVAQIGTSQDSEQLRLKLHEVQHYTLTLSRETTDLLKQLNNLPAPANHDDQRQHKLQRERLTNDFTTVLNNFQSIQRSAKEKEKASINRAKADSGLTDAFQSEIQQESTGISAQQRLQIEQNVDIQTLQEREKAIRQLESDITDVNSIFKDLALMVHEQGEMIDSIEANVDSAQISVEQGSSQIQKAAQYQSKARKKKVICFIVLIVAIGILALVIWLSVRSN